MSGINLFERWAANDKEMTTRVIITLETHWKVKRVGSSGKAPIVMLPFFFQKEDQSIRWNSYEWFILSNNGGEINVEPINHEERLRSVPYTHMSYSLTAETIAWRLWCAMSNQEIDWNYNDMVSVIPDVAPLKIMQLY